MPPRSAYLGFEVFDQTNELLIVLTTVIVAFVVKVQDEEPSVCFFQPSWKVVCGHQERTVDGLNATWEAFSLYRGAVLGD